MTHRLDPIQRTVQNSAAALRVAGISSAVSALTFLVIPHFSLPFIGGVSMPGLLNFLASSDSRVAVIWLLPVLSIAGVVLSWTTLGSSARTHRNAMAIGGFALVNLVAYLWLYSQVPFSDAFGIGLFIGVLSHLVTLGTSTSAWFNSSRR